MEARKLIVSGYYGFGNSGDEAVLWSLLSALETEGQTTGVPIRPIVLSSDPAYTTRLFGVEAVPRMNIRSVLQTIRSSHGLISGGGSLLQDATGPKSVPYYVGLIKLAQLFGKPTFIYAQGVGPVRRPLLRRLIGRVLRKCDYVSVRDEASAELLAELGLDRATIEVVSDPVIGAPDGVQSTGVQLPDEQSTPGDAARPPLIGVSVRFWRDDRRDLQAIAAALQQVASRRSVRIRLLPFHPPGDVEASRWLREQLLADGVSVSASTVEIADISEHPAGMMREVAACDALVGMRLHALIYAAARNVPLVGVSYDPKIDAFLRRLDAEPSFATDAPDADRLAADIWRQITDGPAWVRSRKPVLDQLRHESTKPAQQICRFFRI